MKRGTLRVSGDDRGQSIDYLAARTKRPWIVAGPGPLGVPDVRGREVYGSLRVIGGVATGAPVAPGDHIVLSVPATSTVFGPFYVVGSGFGPSMMGVSALGGGSLPPMSSRSGGYWSVISAA